METVSYIRNSIMYGSNISENVSKCSDLDQIYQSYDNCRRLDREIHGVLDISVSVCVYRYCDLKRVYFFYS